jgi:hypothetical protein
LKILRRKAHALWITRDEVTRCRLRALRCKAGAVRRNWFVSRIPPIGIVALRMREQAAIESGGEENSWSRPWYVRLEHGQPGGKLIRIEPWKPCPENFPKVGDC